MIRRFAHAYRKANAEHPRRMDYAGAAVVYGATLMIELFTINLEPWWMVLALSHLQSRTSRCDEASAPTRIRASRPQCAVEAAETAVETVDRATRSGVGRVMRNCARAMFSNRGC